MPVEDQWLPSLRRRRRLCRQQRRRVRTIVRERLLRTAQGGFSLAWGIRRALPIAGGGLVNMATNFPENAQPWKSFHEDYVNIRGHPYIRLTRLPRFLGGFPREADHFMRLSKQTGEALWKKTPPMIT